MIYKKSIEDSKADKKVVRKIVKCQESRKISEDASENECETKENVSKID